MAGAASRLLLVKKGGTILAGINSKSMSVGSESIDVTTDEDAGYRVLLATAGVETLDLSGSGVTKDAVLRGLILTAGSKLFTDVTIEYPPVGSETTGANISGDFYMNSFSETGGSSDGAIEFDFAMQSSGAWTFTAGV